VRSGEWNREIERNHDTSEFASISYSTFGGRGHRSSDEPRWRTGVCSVILPAGLPQERATESRECGMRVDVADVAAICLSRAVGNVRSVAVAPE
jgi:hypothetical protein